ncbi:MAG: hypothetical protein ACLTPN_02430 [Clostridia bacterium]
MKIETKFNIGERVWVVYEYNGELSVYSDVIDGFSIDNKGDLTVYLKDSDYFERNESDLILYDDTEALIEKIIDTDKQINSREDK